MKKFISLIAIFILLSFLIPVKTDFGVEAYSINELQRELDALIAQRNAANSGIVKTDEEIAAAKAQIETLKAEIVLANETIEANNQAIAFLEIDIANLNVEIKDILVFMQEYDEENQTIAFLTGKSDISQIQHDTEVLSDLTEYNDHKIAVAIAMQDQLEADIVALNEEIAANNKKNLELDALTASLSIQRAQFVSEGENIDDSIAKAQANIKSLVDMGCKPDEQANACVERLNRPISAPGFNFPIRTGVITSEYGYRNDPFSGAYILHTGIDMAAYGNVAVYPTAAGTVFYAGWESGGAGNTVYVHHVINGVHYTTQYAHLASINVYAGQAITTDMALGVMGTTGASTGIHLHFMVSRDWRGVDYGMNYNLYVNRMINPRNVLGFPDIGVWW